MNEKNKIFFIKNTKNALFLKGGLGILLSFLLFSSAFGASKNEISPFNEQLKVPSTCVSELMVKKGNTVSLCSENIYDVYVANNVISDQSKTNTLTDSQVTTNNWTFDIEARRSPILEEHGNVERNESLGGIIKGILHF